MSNRVLYLLTVIAAFVLLAARVADDGGPRHLPEAAAAPGDPLYFDLEVRGPTGQVLSHPQVVSEAGRPTRVELWSHEEDDGVRTPGVCIVLDPKGAVGGIDMSVDLSVSGVLGHGHSRVRMPMGKRRTVRFSTRDGKSVDLTVLAYRVDSRAFHAYLERMRRALALRQPPEA